MPKLVVLSEGFSGKSYELKNEKATVGRLEDNAFHIPEGSISGHHCEILVREGKVHIKDLGSTNGTYIDGKPVSESILKPGHVLRLGKVDLRLDDGKGSGGLRRSSMPQAGVSLENLKEGTQTVAFGKDKPFAKKSNTATYIFIGVGIFLFLVIIGCIVFAISKLKS